MITNEQRSLIELRDVTFSYPGKDQSPVLNIPSWQVSKGEHVFVAGSSGSGKSTLLNLLSGILTPDAGEVSVLDQSLHKLSDRQRDRFRAMHLGYVAQSFNLIPYLSAIENIRLANRFAEKNNTQDITTLLLELNINEIHWHKPVDNLSVGQQQRVAIARAIINRPQILIADEPTSSLDHGNRDAFMTLLMNIADKHNMTLIFVSHDSTLSSYFHRIDILSEINQVEA
ncbi:MAG: ABC transporter ATP-binding protein [Acidiferrobacterales bacterium]|nr:ABC transporter ATP-binding protein [Acidiferrobacterales bacterium]